MATKTSAGLLMYRIRNKQLEVYIVHPGGPFFKNKDEGCWSIPKGELENDEDLLEAAKREFEEETGIPPKNNLIPLGFIIQRGTKKVHAWAFENNIECSCTPKSNFCEVEWPPYSGKKQQIPEVDRAGFFPTDEVKKKINPAQIELIERLEEHLLGSNRKETK